MQSPALDNIHSSIQFKGTCNLASVILNFAVALDNIHSSIQFSSRWTLRFINSISNDLKKLLKYCNGTTIFVSYKAIIMICCFSFKSCFVFKRLRIINSQISISRNFISFKLPWTSWCIRIIIAIFNQILLEHCKSKYVLLCQQTH